LPWRKYGTPCRSTSHLRRHCRPSNGDWKLNSLSAAMHPSVSNNYRVMVLRFTVLLSDLDVFLHYDTIVAFRYLYTFTLLIFLQLIKCFRFHVRNFDFRLNSHRIVYRAMLLSAAVTSASSKSNTVTFKLLPKVIYIRPLIQWSPSLPHFHHKIVHNTFIFGDVIR